VVNDRQRLMEKLRRIEALCARPGTEGERLAATRARERLLARLGQTPREEPLIEMRFRVTNEWSRRLMLALLHKHGLRPYRRAGQRQNTITVRTTTNFAYDVLWPEFERLDRRMQGQFDSYTEHLLAEVMGGVRRGSYSR